MAEAAANGRGGEAGAAVIVDDRTVSKNYKGFKPTVANAHLEICFICLYVGRCWLPDIESGRPVCSSRTETDQNVILSGRRRRSMIRHRR